ncbi:dTDP-4-dehydrorhamnose reductase [Ensifer sp. T173]|uniref:dTDP-4-dehydrorhamnose reductase n=1 Tax=Ensifer canadensis TaxID=555315 RepID=A0AAW4FU19_9HYPH|nr:dTDP-4-dehydrorhamnose reductase [Ensifer canadensis]MBM3094846.1 dTDP-4-dehydrorhamnose reductase [Ensifer canadensis]
MTSPRRFVVTGLTGQVVQSLVARSSQCEDVEIVAIGRPNFDLANADTITQSIEAARPELIVSAAAYTAVDQAESNEGDAFAVNAQGPAALARIAKTLDVPIIHLSTDYVFDGTKAAPYVESDPVAPLGVYGTSKLLGEQLVASTHENHAILRTAWVYSPFGRNFVRTILRAAETRTELGVVDDQVGNPTSALDIADAILTVGRNLLGSNDLAMRGIFHLTGRGAATWAEFAEEIFRVSKMMGGPFAKINRISTSDYPTPARRPANSRLNCERIAEYHGVILPNWKISTSGVVRHLTR